MSVVAKEVALEDLERFMVSFRLDPIKKKRMTEAGIIDDCLELIEEGMLVVDADNKLQYKLLEQITSESGIVIHDIITFNGKRIRVSDVEKIDKKADIIEQTKDMLNALTGIPKAIISKFSVDDSSYLSTIARFFMPLQ